MAADFPRNFRRRLVTDIQRREASILTISRGGFQKPGLFRLLNGLFLAAICFLSVYLGVEILAVHPSKTLIAEAQGMGGAVDEEISDQPAAAEALPQDYAKYAAEISSRNIFSQGVTAVQNVSASQDPLSGRYTLVGFIEGDGKQAIIEDKVSQETFYLRRGEAAGGITVTEVLDGSVVLSDGKSQTILNL